MGLVSPVRTDSRDVFERDAAEYVKAVRTLHEGLQWYAERTTPYPLTVTDDDIATFERLYSAIGAGVSAVITAYLSDPRIQDVLTLPTRHVDLLRRVEGRPYRPGALRPDLLVDRDGVFRVCEINARFPTNGFMCSYYSNEAVDGLGYLAGASVRPVPGLRATMDVLAAPFDKGQPLVVVLDREPGTEIFFLADELRGRGVDVRMRKPSQLRWSAGALVDGRDRVAQVILELERDELVEMPVELFDAIAGTERSFNDVRTLLLGHDKRMLAVLSRPDIMGDLVSPTDLEVFARHLVPTFHAADPGIQGSLRDDRAAWVLKRNSSGRGVGMLVGGSADPDDWEQARRGEADHFTAQAFVPQRTLAMTTLDDGGANDRVVEADMHVVGLLPGFDGRLLGPGMFRAAAGSVINVAGGRGALVPTMLAAGAFGGDAV